MGRNSGGIPSFTQMPSGCNKSTMINLHFLAMVFWDNIEPIDLELLACRCSHALAVLSSPAVLLSPLPLDSIGQITC